MSSFSTCRRSRSYKELLVSPGEIKISPGENFILRAESERFCPGKLPLSGKNVDVAGICERIPAARLEVASKNAFSH
jgi:hypothetical protein